jgi:hypothetical protein
MPELPKELRDAVLGTYAAWLPYASALAEVDAEFRGPDLDASRNAETTVAADAADEEA